MNNVTDNRESGQNQQTKRILLIISALFAGGAERVMSIMANYWAERGEDVTLLTLAQVGNDFYSLNPYVKRVGLGLLFPTSGVVSAIRANILRIKAIRQIIIDVQPDVIISFLDRTNVLTLLAAKKTGTPVIVSERIDPGQMSIGLVWSFLRRKTYKYAKFVIVQTDRIALWVSENIGGNVAVIPNPVLPYNNKASIIAKLPYKHNIVAMGRFDYQKGFDLLLKAFAPIASRYPEWGLTVVGDGEQRSKISNLVRNLSLQHQVYLPGRVDNPWTKLRTADIFVLSSRFEGFPNVLLEAMACGIPPVSFDCPSGPAEIITDNYNGILVPSENAEELALAIERLILQPEERLRLGENAKEVVNKYSLNQIMAQWDKVIIFPGLPDKS